MSSPLRAGTAAVDITPPLTIPYLGYAPRQARFEGVHDRLSARALVLDDGEHRIALVTADAIGFADGILGPGRSFRAAFQQAVAEATGLPPEAVLLAASHAHSTPETLDITALYEVPGAVAWTEALVRALARAVAEAAAGLQPARLKAGRGAAAGIAVNRRQLLADGTFWQPASGPPPAPLLRPGRVDESVGVLLVELEDGTCSAMANFTCHPVSVQVNPLVSADYPGAACALAEASIPQLRHCLFTQGADGDINPRRGGSRRDFGDVARYGHILGGEIIKVVEQLRDPEVEAMAAVLGAAVEELDLPVRPLPAREPLLRECAAARAAAADARTEEERFAAANRLRAGEECLRTIDKGPGPRRTVVQVLRIGDLALAGCPGEPFVDLGLEIKAQSPAPHTLVVGYANDYVGYLATPAAFAEGGYETTFGAWSRVAPEGGRLVVDAALRLLRRLWLPAAGSTATRDPAIG
ncbi:MAG: neutral/alkaline non-lysosomal ceramidase N-terminal domain-containing protein [Gemmatimonadota bacterium]